MQSQKKGMLFCGDVVAMEKRFSCSKAWEQKLHEYVSFCNLEAPILPDMRESSTLESAESAHSAQNGGGAKLANA